MSIDRAIERKKEVLYKTISLKGIMDSKTIKVSEQLDKLIVKRMRGALV